MDIVTWDEFFMLSARLASYRSKDPNTRVGAVIVNDKNRIIGSGYNGMPHGRDDLFPWDREGATKLTKYPYVVHAELNCILNCQMKCDNMIMFVTKFPCQDCAKAIGQYGIKKIVYHDLKKEQTDTSISEQILSACKVKVEKYVGRTNLNVNLF